MRAGTWAWSMALLAATRGAEVFRLGAVPILQGIAAPTASHRSLPFLLFWLVHGDSALLISLFLLWGAWGGWAWGSGRTLGSHTTPGTSHLYLRLVPPCGKRVHVFEDVEAVLGVAAFQQYLGGEGKNDFLLKMVAEASLLWDSAPTTFLTPAPLAHVSHVPWLHFPIFHVIFGMA